MTSMLVSFATLFTLLAGDGLAGNLPAADADTSPSIVPTIAAAIDVPTSQPWGADGVDHRGGRAARIELDDESSTWYRLAYIDGGNRLQVFEDYAATTGGTDSDMELSKEIAWRLANAVTPTTQRSLASDQLPEWARVPTGNDTGLSAGLMLTLAYIDLLTAGPLVGDLRVAGSGGIGPDGVVTPAFGLEVKVDAAMLTNPDVVFTTSAPSSIDDVTIVESKHTRLLEAGYTVGEWLNVNGYQQAGRSAAEHSGTTAIVVVHDVRQALAWLCGRTNSTTACAAADRAAGIPIGTPTTTSAVGYSHDHDSHHD
ncbi:MAG: hypothetical protein ABI862_02775 [Ilumatobacteraceae bacterium]